MPTRKIDRETGEVWWQMADGSMIPQSELMDDSDIGKLDTFLINVGADLHSIGRTVTAPFRGRDVVGAEQQFEQENLAGINARNPLSAGAGQLALSAATLPLGGGVAKQALIGGVEGIARFREEGFDQLLGGATGAALGGLGARVFKAIQEAGASTRAVAREAVDRGLPVTVGERIGGKLTRGVETGLDFLPLGRSRVAEGRQIALNQAANRSMGVTGDKVTEESFDQVSKQVGSVFEKVARNTNSIQMGEEFGEAFRTISSKFTKAAKLKKQTGMLEGGKGLLRRGDFLDVRKTLADYGYAQQGTGNPLSEVALEMVEQLDDALGAQAGEALRLDYGRAREQFRMMKILQRGGTVKASQDVSAPLLNTGLRQNLDQQFFGAADRLKNVESVQLKELTKTMVDPVLNPTVSTSGTAERLLQGGGAGVAAGALLSGNAPLAAGIGAGAVGGIGLNALLSSQGVGVVAEGVGKLAVDRAAGLSRPANQALLDQIIQDPQR